MRGVCVDSVEDDAEVQGAAKGRGNRTLSFGFGPMRTRQLRNRRHMLLILLTVVENIMGIVLVLFAYMR